uniref:HECT-type E3 ubiquitin transferase n=1 Tax=Cacopsylla melanoneura TaxID=428564 RepID=A0A8D8SWN9_9HEMI
MKYLDTAWSFASTWVTVVFCFLSCVTISYFTLEYTQLFGNRVEQKEIDLWLKENNLFMFKDLYQYRGISSLVSCASADDFPELPPHDEERIQRAARLLQQRLILRQWMVNVHLEEFYHRLLQDDVISLEDVYWLDDSKAHLIFGRKFAKWAEARLSLPASKDSLGILKEELWSTVVKSSDHQDAWTLGGMLVVSVSVAGLVTLAAMTQPSLAPEAKHSLLQYVTGKYLQPSNCTVEFDTDPPYYVGDSRVISIRFFQRNNNPYFICDEDNLIVYITREEEFRQVTPVIELGGEKSTAANLARVTFKVRYAGRYRIDISVNGTKVKGSPYHRTFLPGPPDPKKTLIVKFTSIMVAVENVLSKLSIEPRDEFGNTCVHDVNYEPEADYTVFITRSGGSGDDSPCEELSQSFLYNMKQKQVKLSLAFPYCGLYQVVLQYQGETISNGAFDCIVLSSAEAVSLEAKMSERHVSYVAYLIHMNGTPLPRPRKVIVALCPKQVIIREYILKFIPKKLMTYRLSPSTKISFTSDNPLYPHQSTFSLDDTQVRIELYSNDRTLIAASFTRFLLRNIGGSESFKDKQIYLYSEVRRLNQHNGHGHLIIKVNRDRFLESSYKEMKHFSVSDWCKKFDITFEGEPGIDHGGLRREWFRLICGYLFDPKHHLFKGLSDSSQALVHPNPTRPAHLKLKHFEFAGRIVGKCLYESALGDPYAQYVHARFTRSFLAQLTGLRVNYMHFQLDDPDLYSQKVKYICENDVTDLHLTYEDEEYNPDGTLAKTIELIPNGSKILVTNNNKISYLDALARYRLVTCVKDEVDAFLKGNYCKLKI